MYTNITITKLETIGHKNYHYLVVIIYIISLYIFIKPFNGQNLTQSQFLKQGLTGLHSEFFFLKTGSHTKVKELSLPCYLPIAGVEIFRFITFPRVLALC